MQPLFAKWYPLSSYSNPLTILTTLNLVLLQQFNLLVLNEQVLALTRLYRRDVLVFEGDADIKRANRHQAYRQVYIVKFPDPFSIYRGFVGGRLA